MIPLLEMRNPFGEIARHATRSQGDATPVVLGILVGLIVLLLALMLGRYLITMYIQSAPLRLYLRVARAIGLDFSSRWWLWRVARQQGLVSPMALLMSVQTLEHHAQNYIDQISAAEARYSQSRLFVLKQQVFGVESK